MNWNDYRNFSKSEFDCQQTGENDMHPAFMSRLQKLRQEFAKPMVVTSGYRSPKHTIEAAKKSPGPHSTGRACDIAVSGGDAYRLIYLAMKLGFTGIGVNQKGDSRFVHLDDLSAGIRPTVWSY